MKKEAQSLKTLSQRLIALHENIWILDSIAWDDRIKDSFFANGCKELPQIDPDYYEQRSRRDYDRLVEAFSDLAMDVEAQLSDSNPLKVMFLETVTQFIDVSLMLKHRGSKKFYTYSKKLYGSSKDKFNTGKALYKVSDNLQGRMRVDHLAVLEEPKKIFTAKQACKYIQQAVDKEMGEGLCNVRISDGIVADAVAGANSIKLRKGAMYSQQSMDSLVVHEGFVHVATYQNGLAQKSAPFLGVGSPRVTATQEGLAVFMEVANFHSHPARMKRICERVKAIHMAEEGADFLEVYNHFVNNEGISADPAYILASRVFRGGDPKGGSFFTKDLSYVKGLLSLTHFIDAAIENDKPEYLPALFYGKLTLDDIPSLIKAKEEGIITDPKYIPSPFKDVNGLYVWFSLFQSVIGDK